MLEYEPKCPVLGARPRLIVRGLEMRPRADESGRRLGGDRAGSGGDRRRLEAASPKTRLDLELQAKCRRPARRAVQRREGPRQELRVAHAEDDAALRRDPCERRVRRIQHEDRAANTGAPELERLVVGGNAEAVRAGRLERSRHAGGAVAVGIGLDDRLDADAVAGKLADERQVRGQRGDVDLEPREVRQRRFAGRRKADLDRVARTRVLGQPPSLASAKPIRARLVRLAATVERRFRATAIASGRSDAISPLSPNRSRTESPARPWR